MQDRLVASRLHHHRLPMLRFGRGCSAVPLPDAAALTERGAPRVGRIALRPLDAAHDLRRAVLVNKGFPAVRHQRRYNSVQLLLREGRRWCVCRGGLAGPRTLAGNLGQQARRPCRHGPHGNSRHRGSKRRAVRPVRPQSRGVLGKVPVGRGPGRDPAVRAVRFGPVRIAVPALLHRGYRVERGPLQQCLLALPLRKGRRGRLWEGLRAKAAARDHLGQIELLNVPCFANELRHIASEPKACQPGPIQP